MHAHPAWISKLVEALIVLAKAADQILRVAREPGGNLIVMGTYGRTGWRHAVLGSVAEAILRQAPCPVFTGGIGERQSAANACPGRAIQAEASHDEP